VEIIVIGELKMSYIRLSLREKVKGVVIKTAQGYFCIDPDEKFVSKSLIDTGQYGLWEIEQAKTFIGPDSNVLVVGAHVGTVCIPLSKYVEKMYVIEANPVTYELLEINLRLNDCSNVNAYNIAANNANEKIRFVMNTENSGGSKRFPLHQDHAYFYDSPKIIEVDGKRLDDLFESQRFDLIFMDIEGSEYFALLGMQKILKTAKTLIVEFLPHHLSRVAGININQFLEPILNNFNKLTIPSLDKTVERSEFHLALNHMFDNGIGDAGIIFQKC
jgi:FkbM family methyltransferase